MQYYHINPADVNEQPVHFQQQKYPTNLGFSEDNEYKPVKISKINGYLLDNIVEYNKNLSEDEVNGTNVNNITKYNNLLSLSDFDKMLIAKEYEKLYGKSREDNLMRRELWENNRFLNMSLSEIVDKFTKTMMELIHEIPINMEKNQTGGSFDWSIFTRDDRIIYLGILFISLGVFLYFISLSR